MKIIDLLNKIANGEEVPNRFIYNGCLYENYQNGCYRHYDYAGRYTNIENFVSKLCDDFCNLNDEVEVTEEDKKIEYVGKEYDLTSFYKDYSETAILLRDMTIKMKEIIDKLNELEGGKK